MKKSLKINSNLMHMCTYLACDDSDDDDGDEYASVMTEYV